MSALSNMGRYISLFLLIINAFLSTYYIPIQIDDQIEALVKENSVIDIRMRNLSDAYVDYINVNNYIKEKMEFDFLLNDLVLLMNVTDYNNTAFIENIQSEYGDITIFHDRIEMMMDYQISEFYYLLNGHDDEYNISLDFDAISSYRYFDLLYDDVYSIDNLNTSVESITSNFEAYLQYVDGLHDLRLQKSINVNKILNFENTKNECLILYLKTQSLLFLINFAYNIKRVNKQNLAVKIVALVVVLAPYLTYIYYIVLSGFYATGVMDLDELSFLITSAIVVIFGLMTFFITSMLILHAKENHHIFFSDIILT